MCNHCSAHNIDIAAPRDDFHDVAGANLHGNPGPKSTRKLKCTDTEKFDLLELVVEAARGEHSSLHLPTYYPGCLLCVALAKLNAWEKEHGGTA